jgi:predicted phosphodiesterase
MKYAIISDIHSNYKALRKVLVDIKQREVDKIISLGDQIGYGLFPDAVLNELQKQNVESIMGNHEMALFDKEEYNAMSKEGRTAIDENRKFLSEKHLQYLKSLPKTIIENNIRFVHGMPPNSQSTYINRLRDTEILLQSVLYREQIAFCGHTHQSCIYEMGNEKVKKRKFEYNKLLKLNPELRYIINVGSVSFQRGKDRLRSEYAIFDRINYTIEFIKL